ncbi:MAG: NAD(P)H-binding protein [Myxococcaceae bacterium]
MKLVVLGASGGCGAQLVAQAKARGHEVTAVVRSSAWQPPEGVRVERGDLTSEAFLRQAVRGADAVASALGLRIAGLAPWNKPEQPDFLSRSTPALVAALKAEGVKRVIAISAGGVGDSREKMPGFFRAFIAMTALKLAYAELAVMERVLLESGLEVSIPRPSGLTDGPPTGAVKIVDTFKGRATISRADVAGWMLSQLEQPKFSDPRTPTITVTGA